MAIIEGYVLGEVDATKFTQERDRHIPPDELSVDTEYAVRLINHAQNHHFAAQIEPFARDHLVMLTDIRPKRRFPLSIMSSVAVTLVPVSGEGNIIERPEERRIDDNGLRGYTGIWGGLERLFSGWIADVRYLPGMQHGYIMKAFPESDGVDDWLNTHTPTPGDRTPLLVS